MWGKALLAILGATLLISGRLPLGRFPFVGSKSVTAQNLIFRIAGALLLVSVFVPNVYILIGALVALFVGMVVSLSGRAA